MDYPDFLETVRRALAAPLPGAPAQARMSPQPRRPWPTNFTVDTIRPAAGLLLLFPIEERPHILLTVRSGALGRHRGQISMPGGVIDPGESVREAAVREAHEEIGLATADLEILGELTPIDIPVSGFRLHPVVGAVRTRPELTLSEREVAAVIEVPVDTLRDPIVVRVTDREREGQRLVVPGFHIAGHEIWGATAMVLAEFLALLTSG